MKSIQRGSASLRTLLLVVFANMLFGFTIGLPALSAVGLVGLIVTGLWHAAEGEANQRRIQTEATLRQRVAELEQEAEEHKLAESNRDWILSAGIKRTPDGRFEEATDEEIAEARGLAGR